MNKATNAVVTALVWAAFGAWLLMLLSGSVWMAVMAWRTFVGV